VRRYNFHLPCLSSGRHFGGLEVLQILILARDPDLVIHALETVFPFVHCLNQWQLLPLVCVVVLFDSRAFSRVEIDRAKNPESVPVVKQASIYEAASIGLQNNHVLRFDMMEDWCFSKGLFRAFEIRVRHPQSIPTFVSLGSLVSVFLEP